MKSSPTKSQAQTTKNEKSGSVTPVRAGAYEISKSPKSRHKQKIVATGKPLFTPSGARVPPAWTDVWMTTDAKSPIQAIGRDIKGRRVYLYSAEHMGMAAAAKFSRLKAFSKAYLSLIKQVKRDIKTSEDALVLYLIAKTGFRIGSDTETRAEVKAFGASTLRCSHIKIKGNMLSFNFVGKKGIRVNKDLRDSFLAANIANRCSISPENPVFRTNADHIRAYLKSIPKGSRFTVKDFRTYVGTLTAFRKLKTMPIPQTGRERIRYKKEVARTVAKELGNSPTIALNSYVSPEVFCMWETHPPLPAKKQQNIHSTFTKEFLECVHYDQDVPMQEADDHDTQD